MERNDLHLEQLQEEKLLLKIKGDPNNFHRGSKLWENIENFLHQIASQLVCAHPPTFMYLPITYCWVVICDHIDTRISVSYKWDGEGFWEIFCVKQVVQNPQVLRGGGSDNLGGVLIIWSSRLLCVLTRIFTRTRFLVVFITEISMCLLPLFEALSAQTDTMGNRQPSKI